MQQERAKSHNIWNGHMSHTNNLELVHTHNMRAKQLLPNRSYTTRKSYYTLVVLSTLFVLVIIKQNQLVKSLRTQLENGESDSQYSKCPIPGPKRQNLCCNHQRLPYVANLLETAQYLRLFNTSLVRFGDGEIWLMLNRTANFQVRDDELARAMEHIMTAPPENLTVAVPDSFSGYSQLNLGYVDFYSKPLFRDYLLSRLRVDKQYLLTHISSPAWHSRYTNCTLVSHVYDNLREIWRDKDLIILRGNNSQVYQYDVYDTARSQTIFYAPRYNAWSAYKELRDLMLSQNPDALYIMAAGPVSKVIAYDLTLSGRRALDLGHLAKDYNAMLTNIGWKTFFKDD